MSGKKRVAVVGATGFTGKECLRLLGGHEAVDVVAVMSARAEPGTPEPTPGALYEPELDPLDLDALAGTDAVLLCAPHQVAATLVPEVLERTGHVIDLSAAYRVKDTSIYETHYGFRHPHPELTQEAVFGLTEWARDELADARLVANPGCYVTSVLLALEPVLLAGCLAPGSDMIADCKSGVSGAGKSLTATTHFASVHEDFRAYSVGVHRHEPEMREHLGSDRLFFTPHLLPIFRGILATIHVTPAPGHDPGSIRDALRERYRDEPFVGVRAANEALPCIADVQGTNRCEIGVAAHGDRAILVSCLDNLIKGAAGQAIQNLNCVLGLDETTGLLTPSLAPRGWR